MRVKAIVAFALAAIGNVGCGATPIQVPDAGAAGSGGSNPGDGSADAASSNPGGCHAVLASDYDQSCVVDTDCVGVGEVPTCPVSACDGCLAQGINKNAVAQYLAALSQAPTQTHEHRQAGERIPSLGTISLRNWHVDPAKILESITGQQPDETLTRVRIDPKGDK